MENLMRRPLLAALSLALAVSLSGVVAAQAQEGAVKARNVKKPATKPVAIRGRTQTVVITPRYLTAGTIVSSDEVRGSVLGADPRFRTTGRDISGYDQVNLRRDPYYLPYPQTSFSFDSPWGGRLLSDR
ncbi:MAG: hypothetical protein A4S15_06845 [Candidatus Raskinella chloraquaticus]|uniref:Uncharacterized protein n=2 Tax=Candidatus Raskinella chloraquaticus TaxID=1951219 RepID=A0A1W9HYQ7_9HYPH|nr:MAG: hypothetical protein A4S15_06845 [Proteobacteria bacterium SG_bin8]